VSLGSGGSLTLRLDHPAFDGPGEDLYVHESDEFSSEIPENYSVEVSSNGVDFVSLGGSSGGSRGFDLSGSGLMTARFARITDLVRNVPVPIGTTGADIDAVDVLNCSSTVSVQSPPHSTSLAIHVKPNPARGVQELRFNVPSGDRLLRATVYTLSGQVVWQRDLSSPEHSGDRLLWDGCDRTGRLVRPGMYFLRLESQRGTSHARLVRVASR
jgi:hypothetical protein